MFMCSLLNLELVFYSVITYEFFHELLYAYYHIESHLKFVPDFVFYQNVGTSIQIWRSALLDVPRGGWWQGKSKDFDMATFFCSASQFWFVVCICYWQNDSSPCYCLGFCSTYSERMRIVNQDGSMYKVRRWHKWWQGRTLINLISK